MTFHIRRREPAADGLRRIAREQIGIVLATLDDPAVPDTDKVHSLRARCKKMRALLRLAGPVMGDDFGRRDGEFRDAGRRLGELRDAYVQAKTLAELTPNGGDEPPVDGFAADPALLADSRAAMEAAYESVAEWPLPVESFYDLAPGYARTYAKARRAWARCRAAPTDEHFHKLRKWTKYHWYQTRILERINKPAMRQRRLRLQVLGEILGRAHDLAVLESALAGQGAGAGASRSRIDRDKRALYLRALKISRRLYPATPDDMAADAARWWAGWRRERPAGLPAQSSDEPTERKSTPRERSLR